MVRMRFIFSDVVNFDAFESQSKEEVLDHHCLSLGVDGANVSIFKNSNHVVFRSSLKGF